jgi:hypothetical protein
VAGLAQGPQVAELVTATVRPAHDVVNFLCPVAAEYAPPVVTLEY